MADDDLILLVDDEPAPGPRWSGKAWPIAIIDDDPAVHEGTRFALYDFDLNGQTLEILSAYSAKEGAELLAKRPDIAVIFLDVVMETDSAGLELVETIRTTLRNDTVRIILRTGQPGQAPERQVIVGYDINDYKAKTELTADKLFTALTAALRSYQQLQRLNETRRGLEIIIDAASTLFDFKSMQRLAEGVLTQIASLLNADCAGILVLRDSQIADERFSVLAGSGCYASYIGEEPPGGLEDVLRSLVRSAFERRCHEFQERRTVLYIATASGREIVVLVEAGRDLSETDRSLVSLFASRLAVAFDNVILYEQLQQANATLEQRVAKRTADLVRANARLEAQRLDLRRANRLKSEILGTVAHDLKNPLGVILGRAEMLGDILSAPNAALDLACSQIEHIRTSAKRLTGMVDSLMADALNDALDITIRREPMDAKALVAEVVAANRPSAERKGQEMTVRALDDLMVNGDQDRLREAIDNLVSNAIKYTPAGGGIAVSVEAADAGIEIAVKDSGAGLMPEDMARLFGRFQRLSAKPTGGESSTGLGLSIVKKIAELHGGRVSAHSDGPGQGSTFTLVLPRCEPRGP
jgi:signal transduction histidine kinase/CheY-like chemotaxis protein